MIKRNISGVIGTLKHNDSYEGEMIETKIERIVNNNEPIQDGAPLIYTERKDGVQAEYNVRTDRWDVAVDAMNVVAKTEVAKRMNRIAEKESKVIDINKGVDGVEPIVTTDIK